MKYFVHAAATGVSKQMSMVVHGLYFQNKYISLPKYLLHFTAIFNTGGRKYNRRGEMSKLEHVVESWAIENHTRYTHQTHRLAMLKKTWILGRKISYTCSFLTSSAERYWFKIRIWLCLQKPERRIPQCIVNFCFYCYKNYAKSQLDMQCVFLLKPKFLGRDIGCFCFKSL